MKKKDWTIMIYFAGDNVSSENFDSIFCEIEENFSKLSNEKVAVLAHFEFSQPNVKNRRYNFNLSKKNNYYETATNTTDSSLSIYDFVKASIEGDLQQPDKFPGLKAKNYCLIVSGLESGFCSNSNPFEEKHFDVPAILDLKSALKKIKKEITGRKLDIFGFDCCLKNSLEISFEFSKYVKLFATSQTDLTNTETQSDEKNRQPNRSVKLRSFDLTRFNINHSENILFLIEELTGLLSTAFEYSEFPEKNISKMSFDNPLSQLLLSESRRSDNHSLDLKDFCFRLLEQVNFIEKSLPKNGNYSMYKIDDLATALNGSRTTKDTANIKELCFKLLIEIEKLNKSESIKTFIMKGIYSGIIKGIYGNADVRFLDEASIYFPRSREKYLLAETDYKNLDFINTNAGKQWSNFLDYFTSSSQIRLEDQKFY